jgi:hypothetical protein
MPRLIIVGTSDDVDVTHGFRTLIKNKVITEVVLPFAETNETHDQILMAASEVNLPVLTGSYFDEIIAAASPLDIIAVAWDESDECFEAIEWARENKAEIWDISDGLNLVDMETDVLEENLEQVLSEFTDNLVALVYKMVMDQIDDDGKRKYRRSE